MPVLVQVMGVPAAAYCCSTKIVIAASINTNERTKKPGRLFPSFSGIYINGLYVLFGAAAAAAAVSVISRLPATAAAAAATIR